MKTARSRLLLLGLLTLLALPLVVPFGAAQAASSLKQLFSTKLTKKSDVAAGGRQGAMDLHLKNVKDVAVVHNRLVAVFQFSAARGANTADNRQKNAKMKLRILRSNVSDPTGKTCIIHNNVKVADARVQAVFDNTSTDNTSDPNAVTKSAGNTRCSGLYGKEISFPARNLRKVDGANNLYYMNLDIKFQGKPMSADQLNNSGNAFSLNYNLQLVGGDSGKGVLAIRAGASASTDDSQAFGMRSSYHMRAHQASNKTIRASVVFGYPCNITPEQKNAPKNRTVTFYDGDAAFGDTYIWIERKMPNENKASKLSKNDYDINSSQWRLIPDNYWDSSNKRWLMDYSNLRSNRLVIKANAVEPGAEYRLVVYGNNQNSKNRAGKANLTPHENTISVDIPYDSYYGAITCGDSGGSYSLTPEAGVDPVHDGTVVRNVVGQVTTSDTSADHGADVSGNGATQTQQRNHLWRIYVARFSSKPSNVNAPGNHSDSNGCDRISGRNPTWCEAVPSGNSPLNGNKNFTSNFDPETGTHQVSGDFNISTATGSGNWFCFFVQVLNPTGSSSDNEQRKYSPLECSRRAFMPSVQVTGHDLKVGGDISTQQAAIARNNNPPSRYYGSWGEYGVFAAGCNQKRQMTSGAYGSENGFGTNASLGTQQHPLSFANLMSGGDVECSYVEGVGYGGMSDIGGVDRSSFAPNVDDCGGGAVRCDLTAGAPWRPWNSDTTFAAGTRQIIYAPNKTVRITHDLTYGSSYSSIADIPRVVIVAKNIVIDGGVSRIDPWLVAYSPDEESTSGNIATCSTPTGMTAAHRETGNFPDMQDPALKLSRNADDDCRNYLTFNGPVMAKNIFLYRTAGKVAATPERAAESFNLRADAFLTSYSGETDPVASTNDVVDLPPRF